MKQNRGIDFLAVTVRQRLPNFLSSATKLISQQMKTTEKKRENSDWLNERSESGGKWQFGMWEIVVLFDWCQNPSAYQKCDSFATNKEFPAIHHDVCLPEHLLILLIILPRIDQSEWWGCHSPWDRATICFPPAGLFSDPSTTLFKIVVFWN